MKPSLRRRFFGLKGFLGALVEKFQEDRTTTMAASLAFYTILSLAPLSVLILFGFSQLDEKLLDRFLQEVNSNIGYTGGSALELVIRAAQAKPLSGGLASLISLALVMFSASAMFGELRESLRLVLKNESLVCEKKPPESLGFAQTAWHLARDRLLSIAFALLFVLIIATVLVLSAVVSAIAETFGFLHLELPISFALYTGIYSVLYMYGTPNGLPFRAAWKGGAITSFLFMGGKTLIGLYISTSTAAGAYGAAGSLVALLLWIFCASLIVLIGAQAGWLFTYRGHKVVDKKTEEEERKAS